VSRKKLNIIVFECFCERCGHTWIARVAVPKRCVRCKNPYWEHPRRDSLPKTGGQ
jgi:predicted Zn-ribbon and HTH transcriptional regulator